MARTHQALRVLPSLLDSALLAMLLLLATVTPNGMAATTFVVHTDASTLAQSPSGMGISIDPQSFWMHTGENVTLQAVWSTDSPLCSISALWFLWSVEDENAAGFLNATFGPSVIFTAYSFDSGMVVVKVQSSVVRNCGGTSGVVERANESLISIVTPLVLSDVEVSPEPLKPGQVSTLDGSITGGVPPYTANVDWGDGTYTPFRLSGPGAFSINHTYSSGEFVPYVLVSDSYGDNENSSVAETLSVGSGLEAAVIPSSYVAEIGVPMQFSGIAQDVPPGDVDFFTCSNATVEKPRPYASDQNITTFSCIFHSPGTAEVLFAVYPPGPGGQSASAILYEAVVSPPRINVSSVRSVSEVGGYALLRISLSGGAMPVSMTWNLTGAVSGGLEGIYIDGSGLATLVLSAPGVFTFGVWATDALGSVATNDSARVQVRVGLAAHVTEARSLQPYGILAEIEGGVFSGCPPFSWWSVPSLQPENGSPTSGVLGFAGAFSWSGGYAREGNLSITVGVADACGFSWTTGLEMVLVPSLQATFSATSGSGLLDEYIVFNVSVEGGWAPFRLFVNASNNQSWNWVINSAGPTSELLRTDSTGSLVLQATLIDSFGSAVSANLSIGADGGSAIPTPVSPPGAGPTTSAGPSLLDVIGLLASLTFSLTIVAVMTIVARRLYGGTRLLLLAGREPAVNEPRPTTNTKPQSDSAPKGGL